MNFLLIESIVDDSSLMTIVQEKFIVDDISRNYIVYDFSYKKIQTHVNSYIL